VARNAVRGAAGFPVVSVPACRIGRGGRRPSSGPVAWWGAGSVRNPVGNSRREEGKGVWRGRRCRARSGLPRSDPYRPFPYTSPARHRASSTGSAVQGPASPFASIHDIGREVPLLAARCSVFAVRCLCVRSSVPSVVEPR